MESGPAIDIAQLLEHGKVGRFQLRVLALGILALFVNGLDYSAVNVAAPALLRAFHAGRSDMGPVFGWSFFGIFLGSVLFGAVGDRYGRKPGLILSVLAYSAPALLCMSAHSLAQLSMYRLIAGLGIGGAVPNTIALLTETAPRRFRVTFVMAAFVGYSTGNAAIAQVAAWLVPSQGWQIIFLVAGGSGLALSILLAFTLYESLPYLAVARPTDPTLRKLAARAKPDVRIPENAHFPASGNATARFSPDLLFSSYRRIATPLLWIAFFAESLTFMTYSAWLAVILEQSGLAPRAAALTFSYGAFAAVVAILLFGRLIDRFGPRTTVVPAVLTALCIAVLGTGHLSQLGLSVTAVLAMGCAAATHQSLNGIVGSFYPTIIRGNGVGFATGMGRISSIIGPVIVGWLMAANTPLQVTLAAIGAPELVVAAAAIGLHIIRSSRAAAGDFQTRMATGGIDGQPA
ncbi:MAG TPA: MFS transporter [Micropepsaceae bacterium]|nr:MFS transporter [Micropepsaceae bacterium]